MLVHSTTRDAPPRPRRLQFGLLSAEEIAANSVVEVTETTLYYRGLPASASLLDPLMGSVDRRHLCATCMRDAHHCQGHAGHIVLAYPVYSVAFVDTVLKTLRTVCFCCSRVCATDEDTAAVKHLSGRARLQALHAALRGRKTCPHCDMTRPTYSRTPLGIRVDWPADTAWSSDEERDYCTAPFTPREALSILRHLSDEDVDLLGFDASSRPHNMILQNLVVPPPCTRPAIYTSEGSRSRGQNELTVKLLDILKRSHELQAALPGHWSESAVTPEILERLVRMQYEVFSLVSSNLRAQRPAGGGRTSSASAAYKSISDRLKGKEGRVRGNLMGKRVEFSARAVITPDPYFDCDRVGVPYSIAKTLTVPERVHAGNIAELTERVRHGPDSVRGAQLVLGLDGMVTDLASCPDRTSLVLRHGEVVERHLADDDVVVFNRQPSLHLHSMQCHRVRLMPGNTFRLSLPVATPYNADFDGDEMNLHVPRSKVAQAECATLMSVAANVLGAQGNRATFGLVQDALLGMHLLTQHDTLLDHAHACRLVGAARHAPRRIPPPAVRGLSRGRRLWTGKQLFSQLLPDELHLDPPTPPSVAAVVEQPAAALPVVVYSGQLLCGALRKAHLGSSAGGIVDVLCREWGGDGCLRFIADAQRMANAYLLQRGHSVGMHDAVLPASGQTKVDERLAKATQLCEEIQREAMSADAPAALAREAESAILRILSKTLMQAGSIVQAELPEGNAIRRMVTAGSKGSAINLSQICATLGQQSLEGGRIVAEKGDRTLPCFAPNDASLASRGMVHNSFALGLAPAELFMHAVGGREGLVDTAVKTSRTGYLQRRMNKAMEDHRTHEDGTVRTATGDVISFRYGADGLAPARVERAPLPLLAEPAAAVRARMAPAEAELALACRAAVLATRAHVLASELDTRVLLPFNPRRVRARVERAVAGAGPSSAAVAPEAASARVLELAARVPRAVGAALLDVLCASAVAGMPAAAHAALLDELALRCEAARAVPGESVGCLAAQSVGEPATQLTLNTFHTAGAADHTVTQGIPRLSELLDASKSPKTPCTTVRLRAGAARSQECAEYLAHTLPLTRLGDLVARCDIVEVASDACSPEEAWLAAADEALGAGCEAPSRYVVRLELQRALMRARQLTPPIVRALLRERLGGRALVSATEVNAVEWVVRVRFAQVARMAERGCLGPDQESILCHRAANVLLDTVVVSGHPHVTAVAAAEATRVRMDPRAGVATTAQEWVVHVHGSFLADCASSDLVEWERCTSNDIWETLHTLGIEACVHVLFQQLHSVVSYDGSYVDERHLLLICDTVCRGGTLMPLNRHGINKTHASPFMRCSFEETVDVLTDAAIFAERDESGTGVSTAIMTGQLATLGTGAAEVFFHERCAPPSREVALTKPRGRVVRSTVRAHAPAAEVEEVLEYVFGDVRPVGTRPLSPPTVGGAARKRVRFRPESPWGERVKK